MNLAAVPPGQVHSAFQGAAVLAVAVVLMLGLGLAGALWRKFKNRNRR